jgi:porin
MGHSAKRCGPTSRRAAAATMKKVILALLASFPAAFAGPSSSEEISNDADSWSKGDYGTGDWLGVRTQLEDKGVKISGGYTAEGWGNTTGGLKTGAV